jgi:heme/copper-type cytochrome/quinol oxidase subunit 2
MTRISIEQRGVGLVKRTFALLSVLVVAMAIAAPAISARPETTAPGYNYKIKVSITKGGQLTATSLQAKRGWLVHFLVTNKDKVAHKFNVGGQGPKKAIGPGKTVKVGAYSENRGQFAFRVDGKVRGYFVVN